MASYELDLSSDGGTTWSMLTNTTNTNFPITWSTAVPSQYFTYGSSYKFKLTGWNVCGQGKFPYYYSFSTLTTTPKVAPTVTVPVMTGKLITISWTALSGKNATGG